MIEMGVKGVGEKNLWFSLVVVEDLDVMESGHLTKSRSKSLDDGLFGRKPGGIMGHGIFKFLAIRLFPFGEQFFQEAISFRFDRFFDPFDLNDVVANS